MRLVWKRDSPQQSGNALNGEDIIFKEADGGFVELNRPKSALNRLGRAGLVERIRPRSEEFDVVKTRDFDAVRIEKRRRNAFRRAADDAER